MRTRLDELIKRLSTGKNKVKLAVGSRSNHVEVDPSSLLDYIRELRQKNTLAWIQYCTDCTGFVVEGDYRILRANTDYFVFPNEKIGTSFEYLYRANVELIRGYHSLNGYIAVTGDRDVVEHLMKAVKYLLDNDVVVLVHDPKTPCIRVA